MGGSVFGKLFRITTFGESHGSAVGVVIDGCPAGLSLDVSRIAAELERRKPGQSKFVSPRKETEEFEILSGVFEGKTTGTPIAVVVPNSDVRSKDYDDIKDLFRPGHADFTYFAKYGHRDHRGGGRASARETVGRVVAGAVAKQLLSGSGVGIRGAVVQIGRARAMARCWDEVEQNALRSSDAAVLGEMKREIESARKSRDSVGGVVEVEATGVPSGWGEPVFEKLDAAIAGALMSIPGVKGVEIGAGFAFAEMRGSEAHDRMSSRGFCGNNHGGILGGISSGAPIVARAVLKPTSSIATEMRTVDTSFRETTVSTKGRHDPCIAVRAVPVAEAMLALVLVDYWLQDLASISAQSSSSPIDRPAYGLDRDY